MLGANCSSCCCVDITSDVAEIVVSLSACALSPALSDQCVYQDVERHWQPFTGAFQCPAVGGIASNYMDEWFFVNQFNGVFTLSRNATNPNVWEYVTQDAAGCQSRIFLDVIGNSWDLKVSGRQVSIMSYLGNASDRPTFSAIQSCQTPNSDLSKCKHYHPLPNGGQYVNTLLSGKVPCFTTSQPISFTFPEKGYPVIVGGGVEIGAMYLFSRSLSARGFGSVTFQGKNPLP